MQGITDGNQEDVIKECRPNTLRCAVYEDLTLGGQDESERTGKMNRDGCGVNMDLKKRFGDLD